MKIIIDKILSQKKIIGIILLAIGLPAAYTVYGVYQNLQAMQNVEEVNYFPPYPAVNIQDKNPDLVKRGEYLVKAGDCIACHTNTLEKGKPFAGGLPMRTPFGTIYSPNITPDKKTGIGNWTDEQFIKAMRQGIAPAGHYYYPAFPYLYFNEVTTEDLKAIKAYLDSIPAINQANRDNEMVFPFNFRIFQLGWRLLFFHTADRNGFVPNHSQSAQWNRGAYLTEGLGHCAMCHTPSYYLLTEKIPLGAPIQQYSFAGSKTSGYLAPNISKKNLDNVPIEEIVEVFTKNRLIGGGTVEGPMLEVNRNSLSHLSQEDLTAIAVYLKSIQSKSPPLPSGSGGPGRGIYDVYCSGCHANGAGGAPKYGDVAGWAPLMKDGIEKVYTNAIKGYGGMPAKGTCLSCSDDEIKLAVDYMINPVKGKTAGVAAKPKKLTLADGERLYQSNCSVCHEKGFNGAPIPGNKAAWQPIIKKGFVEIYQDVNSGRNGHPPHGACANCTDEELIAAIKYMLQTSSEPGSFSLW